MFTVEWCSNAVLNSVVECSDEARLTQMYSSVLRSKGTPRYRIVGVKCVPVFSFHYLH